MKSKILCVDDDVMITKTLYFSLCDSYEVLVSNSPIEALKIIENNKDISLILSDHMMPEMTGCELLANAKIILPNAHRLLVSGYVKSNELQEYLNNGVVEHYISKPWNLLELLKTLKNMLQH